MSRRSTLRRMTTALGPRIVAAVAGTWLLAAGVAGASASTRVRWLSAKARRVAIRRFVPGPARAVHGHARAPGRARRLLMAMHVASLLLAGLAACGAPAGERVAAGSADALAAARGRMVDEQIAARGVNDPRVLQAMRSVPRHEFVPPSGRDDAYDDRPLPIGDGQTISQPYIVALMTELAAVKPGDRVLEIGTGSGYQAAVLAELGADVYSIEIVEPLARRARETLRRLGYDRVHLRQGDGYRGWPEAAPFQAVVVTAAPPAVPPALVAQLAPGGRLVIPVGTGEQELEVHERTASGVQTRRVAPVRFVPMVGGP